MVILNLYPFVGVSSEISDDIYEIYDDGMYLQTTEEPVSEQSHTPEDGNFESLHQKFAPPVPKSYTKRPVPPIPYKPPRSQSLPTADEKDSTYTKVNRPTVRPLVPRKQIFPRQVSQELDEKLSRRLKSADFEDSFIRKPFVESNCHSFEVLYDFNAEEYCKNNNLGDSCNN